MTDVTDWVPVSNVSGELIPSGALARVTGVSGGHFTIAKPDTDSAPNLMSIGLGLIPAGGKGQGTLDPRAVLAYEEADGTPAAGEEWGAASGSWKLRKGKSGWRILGGAGGGLVNVVRAVASTDAEATVHYKKVTGPGFTITADNTWQDTGVSIILPAAGTYLIDFSSLVYAQVSAQAFPTSVASSIATRFYDVTNSFVIADSFTWAVVAENTDRPVLGTFLMRCVYTVTGQATIRAEAWRNIGSTWTISIIGNSGAEVTTIGYQRLDLGTGGPAGPAGPTGPTGPAGTPGANAPDDPNAVIGSQVFGF
ncbi:MAG TPA: hypothetical protein VGE74_27410 [Gemmata sp.]